MKNNSKKLSISDIDLLIVPSVLLDNNTCCPEDPCLRAQLLQFALELNRVKNRRNYAYFPRGCRSASDLVFCPVKIRWNNGYKKLYGKPLVLDQFQMRDLYDFLSTKKSLFGPIIRYVVNDNKRYHLKY